jgi:hypothetical protein
VTLGPPCKTFSDCCGQALNLTRVVSGAEHIWRSVSKSVSISLDKGHGKLERLPEGSR